MWIFGDDISQQNPCFSAILFALTCNQQQQILQSHFNIIFVEGEVLLDPRQHLFCTLQFIFDAVHGKRVLDLYVGGIWFDIFRIEALSIFIVAQNLVLGDDSIDPSSLALFKLAVEIVLVLFMLGGSAQNLDFIEFLFFLEDKLLEYLFVFED